MNKSWNTQLNKGSYKTLPYKNKSLNSIELHKTKKTIYSFSSYFKIVINIILLSMISILISVCSIFLIKSYYFQKKYYKKEYKNNKNVFCNSGYYLPLDEDQKNINFCKKCELENCEKCYGTNSSNTCILCKSSFISIYDINNRIKLCDAHCEIGEKEKCQSCNKNGNQCENCNSGYYLPEDDLNKKVCKKCSLKNCKKCNGTSIVNNCTDCEYPLIPFYNNEHISFLCDIPCEIGQNEKCQSCNKIGNQCEKCNSGYYLPEDDLEKKYAKNVQLKIV